MRLTFLIGLLFFTRDASADDRAHELLRAAFESRYTWDAKFPGFKADVGYDKGGKEVHASLTVAKDYRVELSSEGEADVRELRETLQSIVDHRRPTDVNDEHKDSRLEIRESTSDGALIVVAGDPIGTAYRVKDGKMTQIIRDAKQFKFTIQMLEWLPIGGGKFLPSRFRVTSYKPGSQDVTASQEFTDVYAKVGEYYLPKSRTVVSERGGQKETTKLTLSRHELTK
jgi:hypothetical protein